MGYDAIRQERKGNIHLKVIQANGAFAQFESAGEVADYIDDNCADVAFIDFDNDKTAKDILRYAGTILLKKYGIMPSDMKYWVYYPVKAFSESVQFLYNNYHKFRVYWYMSEEQNIAAINKLVERSYMPIVGNATHLSMYCGSCGTVEFENDQSFSIFFKERPVDPSGHESKYAIKIAKDVFLSPWKVDSLEPPRCLGGIYGCGHVEGNKAIYSKCDVREYRGWVHFTENIGRHDSEAFEEAWESELHKKAIKMLRDQLLDNFGDDVLGHVEICEEDGHDGFTFDSDDMLCVSLSFDRKWLTEWCLENYEEIEYI